MATHHGKEGVVKAGGTAIGEITGFTLETTADVVEDTELSDATKSFLAGRTSFSGTLEMSYDETDSPQQTLTAGSSIAFILLPEGATSGDESFTGSGIVTGMSVNNGMDAVITRSVTFQGTGALTRGTV
ncbi:putative tail protein [Pelagibacter phage HTVC026P]|nr:putative tail protein [Pelagibacter phage HTVC026P]|tara:strand:- start:9 stop:395 length:387 start_codon:yes stop_codon:yes gene_type:complete